MNLYAIKAIYTFEMARWWRTALQSVISPVVSTSLYFVVFGAAIGSRIESVEGVSYGAFIVPGLIMLSLLHLVEVRLFPGQKRIGKPNERADDQADEDDGSLSD